MIINQLKQYTCFISETGMLIIVIPAIQGLPHATPKILYDGGDHALFYRRADEPFILDYLNDAAKIVLRQGGKVLLFEVDTHTQNVISDYFLPVVVTPQLPAFELKQTTAKAS